MGYITTTIYKADGTEESTKTDTNGNVVTDEYFDEDNNYVIHYFDEALNADVTLTTDSWGFYSIEYFDGQADVYEYYGPSGNPIPVLPVSTPPTSLAVGNDATSLMYHITWDQPADNMGYDVTEYTLYWDDYS